MTENPTPLPRELELLLADMNGVPRGKSMAGDKYSEASLPHFAEAIFFQTITGDYSHAMEKYVPMDRDLLMRADWSTYAPTPWKNDSVGQVICETIDQQGKPISYDPRNVLKRVLASYKRLGLTPILAPEVEFYLLDNVRDAARALTTAVGMNGAAEFGGEAFSLDALQKFGPLLDEIRAGARTMSIDLSAMTHEMGPAQIELNVIHGDALSRADQLFLLKRMIKGTAAKYDVNASFMGKPIAGLAGNGMHLHISMRDRSGANVFALVRGKAPAPLRAFVAGLQNYLPDAFALLAPNVNSYKRFVRDTSAPINLEWGYDNRTTGLRVPFSEDTAGRVESRVAGADANPYLLIAATLAAGLLGLREEREPSKPVESYGYDRPPTLPTDLPQALRRLHGNKALSRMLGGAFVEVFTAVKAEEMASFSSAITAWETKFLGTSL